MNDMQNQVVHTRFLLKGKWPHVGAEDSLLYLFTELAEVSDVVLRIFHPDHKRTHPLYDLDRQLKKELGDVQLMLCTLANLFHVDLIEACSDRCEDKLSTYGGEE